MKKILLFTSSLMLSISAMAQLAVTGISPASIQGNYVHSLGETSQSWGLNLNFSTPGVHVQGSLVMVEDGSTGTNAQGNPISQEGCNPLTNGAAVDGKIAVIFRNTCDFGVKAKNAQNAGAIAVIILNRDDEAVGMNGGTTGATVTIPVVMLSSSDGLRLRNAMATDEVVLFIGNKAGLNAVDLAMNEELLAVPTYHTVHKLLATNATDFGFDLGLRVYNHGTTDQPAAIANAKVVGPNNTVVYNESVTINLNGVAANTVDSVDIFPGEAQSFPRFALADYPVGMYTLTYTLSANDNANDGFPNDNVYSTTFYVNDNFFSRAQTNEGGNGVKVTAMTRPAAPTGGGSYNEVMYCSSFSHPSASRLAVTGMEVTISKDSTEADDVLAGTLIFYDVYKWHNASSVYAANTGSPSASMTYSIENISSNGYDFVDDVARVTRVLDFAQPVVLEDNMTYLFCVSDFGANLNIGFDRTVDYNVTRQLTNQWINPLRIDEGGTITWYGAGFGADITPAFGIKAVSVAAAGIKESVALEGRVYPNPASDKINMQIEMDGNATVQVTDLAGRVVSTQSVSFLNNTSSMEIGALTNGMFIVNVVFDNGSKSTFNFIKN